MPEEITFTEGQKFQFTISGRINLPGTGEGNWILTGPGQKKYLLTEKYYTHYQLQTGQRLRCLIDKINCSGKIFLEPDHPFYTVGEKYEFPVLRISEPENFIGKPHFIAWVQDLHGREWPCPVDLPEGIESRLDHLTCRVDQIRKAELTLSVPAMINRFMTLKTGRNYQFKIEDIRTFENKKYYLLKDENGDSHRLPLADYIHYDLKKGDSIEATVVKYNPDGECVIEPVHPYYRIGEPYPFRFVKLEKTFNVLGYMEAIIFVEDIYNQSIKVKPLSWQVEADNYCPEEIYCLVKRLKMGKPVLVTIDKISDPDKRSVRVNTN